MASFSNILRYFSEFQQVTADYIEITVSSAMNLSHLR